MSNNLREHIKDILEPLFNEKGFIYDQDQSKPRQSIFVFSKGDPEPKAKWPLDKKYPKIQREEITIYKFRGMPMITAEVRSVPKKGCRGLFELMGLEVEKWWPIETDDETRSSLMEIKEWMNKCAWEWFILK